MWLSGTLLAWHVFHPAAEAVPPELSLTRRSFRYRESSLINPILTTPGIVNAANRLKSKG